MSTVIDLRSDTVTVPCQEMLNAMRSAEVGDDVYGDDPTVNRLEQRVSELLGFEAALFTPSGTMANQIALHCHTRHGDSVLAEEDSHVFLYEAGAAAAQSGVQFDLIPLHENWSIESMESRIKPEWLHYASTALITVENTHNRGYGRPLDVHVLTRIQSIARKHKLPVHCDGARIWNAAVALNCPERSLTAGFDSVSVCFSKGLGAPVGSALLGSRRFIERARKIRKRWGGGMRQAGYLAAAALFALEHNRVRLAEDHKSAKCLHDGMVELAREGLAIKPTLPEIWTNILYFTVLHGDKLVENLRTEGILVNHLGQGRVRAVTHMHIDNRAVAKTLDILRRTLKNAK